MAITFLKARVINPERPKRSRECEFLVDSGAVYSVVPESMANGEVVRKPVGNAYFRYGGKIRAAPVVFGEEGVFLLGATTIEALGMILDPIRRELKPLPMVLMSTKAR
jgi:hypothetical protein